MRYGHFRYYWLALLAGVTGHQMLLQFTLHWLMFQLTGEVINLVSVTLFRRTHIGLIVAPMP